MKNRTIEPVARPIVVIATVIFAMALFTTVTVSAETDMTDAPNMIRLAERVDLYYTHLKGGDSLSSFGMLAEEWRSGSNDERDWVKDRRKNNRLLRILEWRVTEIEAAGERARIRLELDTQVHEGFWKWNDRKEDRIAFWVFEQGDWYHIPSFVKGWEDEGAVEVPIPVLSSE